MAEETGKQIGYAPVGGAWGAAELPKPKETDEQPPSETRGADVSMFDVPTIQGTGQAEEYIPQEEVTGRSLDAKASDLLLGDLPTALIRGVNAPIEGTVEMLGSLLQGKGVSKSFEESVEAMKDVYGGKRGIATLYEDVLFSARNALMNGWDITQDRPEGEGDHMAPWLRQVARVSGTTTGTVGSFIAAGRVLKIAGTLNGAIKYNRWNQFARSHPLSSTYIKSLVDNVSMFAAHGQLEKNTMLADLDEKAQRLEDDAVSGLLFSHLSMAGGLYRGGITRGIGGRTIGEGRVTREAANAVVEYPVMFTAGLADAYRRDPEISLEDAATNGLVLALMHQVMQLKDEPVKDPNVPELPRPTDVQVKAAMDLLKNMETRGSMSDREVTDISRSLVPPTERTSEYGKAREAAQRWMVPADELPGGDLWLTGKYLASAGILAERWEAKTGLPLFTKVYRGFERQANDVSRFNRYFDLEMGRIFKGKETDVVYMDRLGDLGIALEDMNVSVYGKPMDRLVDPTGEKLPEMDTMSKDFTPEAVRIAKEMGMGRADLARVAELQQVWLKLWPFAKAINPKLKLQQNFWPKIEVSERDAFRYSTGEYVPEELMFGVRKRAPNESLQRVKNPVMLTRMYANQVARKLFFDVPLRDYNAIRDYLIRNGKMPELVKRMDEFVNANIGRNSGESRVIQNMTRSIEDSVNKTFDKTIRRVFKDFPQIELTNNLRDIMYLANTVLYAGTIGGLNVRTPTLQLIQALQFAPAEFGTLEAMKYVSRGYADAGKMESWQMAADKGWIKEDLPMDKAIKRYDRYKSRPLRKVTMSVTDAARKLISLTRKADAVSRVVVGSAAYRQFSDAFVKHKGNADAIIRELNLEQPKSAAARVFRTRRSKSATEEIRDLLNQGMMEDARDSYCMLRLRNTNFSQLPGEFPITPFRDFGGRSLYVLQSFPLHALNVAVNKWSIEQLAVFTLSSTAIVEGMRAALKADLKGSFGPVDLVGPVVEWSLPWVDMVSATMGYVNSALNGNKAMQKASREELGRAFGVFTAQPKDLDNFIWSVQNGWKWRDSKGRVVGQSTPYMAVLRLLGVRTIEESVYYDKRRAESDENTEREIQRDKLEDIMRMMNPDKRQKKLDEWIKENPYYVDWLGDPQLLKGLFEVQMERMQQLKNVPEEDKGDLYQKFKEVDDKYQPFYQKWPINLITGKR